MAVVGLGLVSMMALVLESVVMAGSVVVVVAAAAAAAWLPAILRYRRSLETCLTVFI